MYKLLYEVNKMFIIYAALLMYGDAKVSTVMIYDVQDSIMNFNLNISLLVLFIDVLLILIVVWLIIKEFYNVRMSEYA